MIFQENFRKEFWSLDDFLATRFKYLCLAATFIIFIFSSSPVSLTFCCLQNRKANLKKTACISSILAASSYTLTLHKGRPASKLYEPMLICIKISILKFLTMLLLYTIKMPKVFLGLENGQIQRYTGSEA